MALAVPKFQSTEAYFVSSNKQAVLNSRPLQRIAFSPEEIRHDKPIKSSTEILPMFSIFTKVLSPRVSYWGARAHTLKSSPGMRQGILTTHQG